MIYKATLASFWVWYLDYLLGLIEKLYWQLTHFQYIVIVDILSKKSILILADIILKELIFTFYWLVAWVFRIT